MDLCLLDANGSLRWCLRESESPIAYLSGERSDEIGRLGRSFTM
jgi:hypothetical protein